MTARPRVVRSLVIPMFQEASRIVATIDALAASSLNRDDTEFVFVDDGSTDDTPHLVEQRVKELRLPGRVVRLDANCGKGAAVRAGVAEANGSVIAFCDADLSAPTDAVEECFRAVESGNAAVVIATRLRPQSSILTEPPLLRRYSGKAFNVLLRGLGLTDLPDTQCGLKAFTRAAATDLFAAQTVDRFAFDVELIARARRLGFAVAEVPITWRHVEASRVRPVRDGLQMAADVVRLAFALRRDRGPASVSMDEARFATMARLERTHWWFKAKRSLVADELAARSMSSGVAVDVGCGTGAMVTDLRGLGFDAIGVELSAPAVELAKQAAPGAALGQSTAEMLPLADASVTCLTALDVIEHLDDDVKVLREFRRVLKPNGVVVIAVPAYEWAWSAHDEALGHRRRYSETRLRHAASSAGLRIERTTYFHSWLVAPAALLRLTPLRLLVRGGAEEASFVNPAVNAALDKVASVERLVARRAHIPLGLSILLVARR